MSELPPPFFSEPIRVSCMQADGEAFTGPNRLARETASATVSRNDRAMADALARAWRSGAPDDLLSGLLATYASAHELDQHEAQAIAAASHFVATTADDAHHDDVELLGEIAKHVTEPLGEALADAQGDGDPCWCAACIAEAASLN